MALMAFETGSDRGPWNSYTNPTVSRALYILVYKAMEAIENRSVAEFSAAGFLNPPPSGPGLGENLAFVRLPLGSGSSDSIGFRGFRLSVALLAMRTVKISLAGFLMSGQPQHHQGATGKVARQSAPHRVRSGAGQICQ